MLSDHNRASLGTSSKFIGRLQFQAHQPGQLLLPRGKRGGNRETSNGIPKTCLWFGLLSWSGFGATSIWSHWLEWFLHFQYVGFAYQFEPTTRYSIQSKYRVKHNLWSILLYWIVLLFLQHPVFIAILIFFKLQCTLHSYSVYVLKFQYVPHTAKSVKWVHVSLIEGNAACFLTCFYWKHMGFIKNTNEFNMLLLCITKREWSISLYG